MHYFIAVYEIVTITAWRKVDNILFKLLCHVMQNLGHLNRPYFSTLTLLNLHLLNILTCDMLFYVLPC